MLARPLAALLLTVVPTAALAQGKGSFVQVDLELQGAGFSYHSESIKTVLDAARRNHIDAVVFVIEAGLGGYPDEARAVGRLISEADDLRTIAVFSHALGGSLWPAMACDEIYIVEEGMMSAHSLTRITGDASDIHGYAAKGPEYGAELAALAEKNGRPAVVARAMFDRPAELWLLPGPLGEPILVDSVSLPADETPPVLLDGPNSVFILSAQRAEAFGIAKTLRPNYDLEKVLGLRRNAGATAFARKEIKQYALAAEKAENARHAAAKAQRERARTLTDKLSPRLQIIDASFQTPEALDPRKFTDYSYDGMGRMQPASRDRWQARTDDALDAWFDIEAELRELRKLHQEAVSRSIDPGFEEIEIDLRLEKVAAEVNRLQKERSRATR
jgi:hypothetical protein